MNNPNNPPEPVIITADGRTIPFSALLDLPNCPITFEVREECKYLEPGQKPPRSIGRTGHFAFTGTAEQFRDYCNTMNGAMEIDLLWSEYERLFVTFDNGETVEIE